MTAQMETRVVGRVLGRVETLAFVTDENGLKTRVRWSRRHGYDCDEHGRSHNPTGCEHALAASVAFRWQRKNERERTKQ